MLCDDDATGSGEAGNKRAQAGMHATGTQRHQIEPKYRGLVSAVSQHTMISP